MRRRPFSAAFVAGAAIACAAPAQAVLPPQAQPAYERGLAAARQGQWDLAILAFQEARQTAPEAPEPLYNLGLVEAKRPGREMRAMAWLGAYLAASPNASNAQAIRGLLASLYVRNAAELAQLIALVEETSKQVPKVNQTYVDDNLVQFRGRNRQFAEAAAIAARYKNNQGFYPNILSDLVVGLSDGGDLNNAAMALSKLDEVDRGTWSVRARTALAKGEVEAGDIPAALATLRFAVRIAAIEPGAFERNRDLDSVAGSLGEIHQFDDAEAALGMMSDAHGRSGAQLELAKAELDAGRPAAALALATAALNSMTFYRSLSLAQRATAGGCFDCSKPYDIEVEVGELKERAGDLAGAHAAYSLALQEERGEPSGDLRNMRLVRIADGEDHLGNFEVAEQAAALDDAPGTYYSRQRIESDVAFARKLETETHTHMASSQAKPVAEIPYKTTPPPTVWEWTQFIAQLNRPVFLDLAAAVRSPQKSVQGDYGAPCCDDKNPEMTLHALMSLTETVETRRHEITLMLRRQFPSPH